MCFHIAECIDYRYNIRMASIRCEKQSSRYATSSILMFLLFSSWFIYADPIVVSGGLENDYESWIIRTQDNRLMTIFCRNPDWQSGDLYVTFSTDNGATWGTPSVILESPEDQATLSFLQLPGDTFRLWYASNENINYGIYTAHSLDGVTWNRDGVINLGWSIYDMHYDPTVIEEPDSSLTMSYRGPAGAYIAHKPYGGNWDTLRTLVGASGFRPRIMKHSDGNYLLSYHRNTANGYEVFVRTSLDRINWTPELQLTFQGNSHDPFPNETGDGAYLLYYATHLPPAYNLNCRKSYDAINWESEVQITFDQTNNTQPHFFVETNEIYLIWAHAVLFPDDHDVYFERLSYTGVDESDRYLRANEFSEVSIFPNPCSDHMNFIISANAGDIMDIQIYDVQGEVITGYHSLLHRGRTKHVVETMHLCPGVYFLRISCASGDCYKRFVVIH